MRKKLKIVIIYPPTNLEFWNFVPEGIARLSAYLKQQGFCVKQINLDAKCLHYNLTNEDKIDTGIFLKENVVNYLQKGNFGPIDQTIEKMLDLCALNCADMVCFSVMYFTQLRSALCLAKKIKERTGVKIIFGGDCISRFPNYADLFNNSSFIDFIVLGPGEISLSVLAEMLNNGKVNEEEVPGLIYREGKHIRKNPKKICRLDALPTPDYGNSINYYLQNCRRWVSNKYLKMEIILPYQVSRGCIHKCKFCNHAMFEKVEFRSPEKIISDLKEIISKHGIRRFWFGCNTLNMSKKYVTNLCKAIINNNLDICWEAFIRAENLDCGTLSLMKRAGCNVLEFGVETGSQRLLDYLNKDISVAEIEKTLKNTKKAGIITKISLMLNIPTETEQNVRETSFFIERNAENIDLIVIHRFVYLPGTPLFQADKVTGQVGWYLEPPKNVNEINELFDMIKEMKDIVMIAHPDTFFDNDYCDLF